MSRLALPRLSLGQATILGVGAQVVASAATILAVPYLVDRLGVEPFGIVAAVAVLTNQLGALQLGIGPAATRLLAGARGRGDLREHAAMLRAVLLLCLLAAALAGLGFRLAAPLVWSRGFEMSAETLQLALSSITAAALVAAAQPALTAGFAVLVAEEAFALHSVVRVVYGLARVGLTVAAVALGGGVEGALWAQALVDIVTTLIIGLTTPVRGVLGAPARPIGASLRRLLGVGVPFAGADVFNALLVDAEKLMIGMFLSVAALTYYTVPFNAIFRLAILGTVISSVLLSRIASVAAAGESQQAARLTQQATRLTIVAMAGVLAPLIAVAPELLTLWLGADFASRTSLVSRLLLVGIFANASVYAAHAAVRARGRPLHLTALYAAEVVVHLGVVYFAVRAWGLPGAAVAWTVRVVIDAVAQRIMAIRALGHPIGAWREFWLPLAGLTAFVAVCEEIGLQAWGMRAGLGIGVGLVILFWLLGDEDRKVLRRTVLARGARA